MSLINQVLQDLDAREPQREPAAVTLVEPASPSAADSGSESRDWLRVGVWVALAIAVTAAAAWSYLYVAPEPPGYEPIARQVAPASPPAEAKQETPVAEQNPVTTADATQTPSSPSLPAEASVVPPARSLVMLDDVVTEPAPEAPAPQESVVESSSTQESVAVSTPARRISVKQPAREEGSVPGSLDHARMRISQGRIAEAEAGLRQLLANAPGHRTGREMLVGILMRGGRDGEALAVVEAGLKQHPDATTMRLMAAHLKARGADIAGAIVTLEAADRAQPQVLELLAALYQRGGRMAAAAEAYRALLARNPGTGRWHAGLGMAQEALGQIDVAVVSYRQALAHGGLVLAVEQYLQQRVQTLAPDS